MRLALTLLASIAVAFADAHPSRLRLKVVDTAAAAVGRAQVEVRGPGGVLARTSTDEYGEAVLLGLPARTTLTLLVTAPGFAGWQKETAIYTDCQRTVKLEVRSDLQGTEYFADPLPLPTPIRKPWWRRLWR